MLGVRREHFQVFRPVVVFHPVPMMHDLARKKWAPQHL
jgi:hypothetical protein